ncbi:AAA family ATPase [Granulicella arctica]|uniref:AAA family ATPase n=1 Tax=Granulicella arctica TaxID=940613 RepID=UPI0037BF8666
MLRARHLPLTLSGCYHSAVFLVPPWEEIYTSGFERRHGFAEAVSEYERLDTAYRSFGYDVIVLPRQSIQERAALVLSRLASKRS